MAYEHLPLPIALHLTNFQLKRRSLPVWYDEQTQIWHIYRYADALRVLTDSRTFGPPLSSPSNQLLAPGAFSQPPADGQGAGVARTPDFVGAYLSEALNPRAVLQLQPYIERTAGELLDSVLPAGKLEVMSQLAWPLASSVIAELIGVPVEDRASTDYDRLYFARLVSIASADASDIADRHPISSAGTDPNLLSRLPSITEEGPRFADDEVAASGYYFMAAARARLADTLGDMLLLVSMQPELLKRLRQQPAPLYSTVEEALRYLPAVWTARRTSNAQVAVGGHHLPGGADVCVWLVSANHDPEQFDRPERFDIDRIPNRHLTFGDVGQELATPRRGGTFSCLGGGLARLVARLTLTAIAKRIDRFEVAPGEAVVVASPGVLEEGRGWSSAPEDPKSAARRPAADRAPNRCSLEKLAVVFDVRTTGSDGMRLTG